VRWSKESTFCAATRRYQVFTGDLCAPADWLKK
jgi:hypothetical protein